MEKKVFFAFASEEDPSIGSERAKERGKYDLNYENRCRQKYCVHEKYVPVHKEHHSIHN
jgi:hypothetical protein